MLSTAIKQGQREGIIIHYCYSILPHTGTAQAPEQQLGQKLPPVGLCSSCAGWQEEGPIPEHISCTTAVPSQLLDFFPVQEGWSSFSLRENVHPHCPGVLPCHQSHLHCSNTTLTDPVHLTTGHRLNFRTSSHKINLLLTCTRALG